MCKKNVVVFILIFLCNLAYGQVNNDQTNTNQVNNLSVAQKNIEIDQNKYGHPDDFIYEEKIEDVQPEDAEEPTYQQQIPEAAAEQESAYNHSAGDL